MDRGPETNGVIRRVEGLLRRYPGSAAIAGNHEDKALRLRDRGRIEPKRSEPKRAR